MALFNLKKIISGGQTGADRGGLDAGYLLNLQTGGWCPKGRRAEDGKIPVGYDSLKESPYTGYTHRTIKNIQGSDGTVIFIGRELTPGSKETKNTLKHRRKPWFVISLVPVELLPFTIREYAEKKSEFLEWLTDNKIETLNVAGSRESKVPGIQTAVCQFLLDALKGR